MINRAFIMALIIIIYSFPAYAGQVAPAQKVYNDVSQSVFTVYSVDRDKETNVSLGSAVAVDEHLLATNCHVALAGSFLVVYVDKKPRIGRLYYYKQKKDLCLIEIPGTPLKPVNIRPSKSVEIGEEVYAIGNPEGRMKTISRGIISNKAMHNGVEELQTDAAISEGSSGGGLFDKDSNLIGITTSGDKNGENIGFAIPTELILEVIDPPKKESASKGDGGDVYDNPIGDNEREQASKKIEKKDYTIRYFDLISNYGNDDIGLIHWNKSCAIVIKGRYRPNQVTSLAIWLPSVPDGLFIFSRITNVESAVKLLNEIYRIDDTEYKESKSYAYLDRKLYGLILVAKNNENLPVYILSINSKHDLSEKLIGSDYFLGQFYNYSHSNGMTTIKFGLNGFTEAFAAYNEVCNQDR